MNDEALQAETGLFQENGAPIPLEGVEVHGDIAGRAVTVRIRQRFRNAESLPIEAVYKFPLPEKAALCGFRAFVDERMIEGEIEEREKAFALYDNALSEGHGAQLLDEERPNLFTLSVGNIKPRSTVVIEIHYATLLDTEGAEVRFFLPTTISPRYTPDHQQEQNGIPVEDIINPPVALSVPYGLKLNIGVHNIAGISSIESPSHPIHTEFSADKAAVYFASETAAMDRDFILTVAYKQTFSTRGFLFEGPEASYFQIDFLPEEENAGNHGKGPAGNREILFVLDCSGSMAGSSITEAKKALEIMIKALIPGTLFNIYRFGSSYEHLFRGSRAYDEKRMKEALQYLLAGDANLGGTEMLAPLKEIYSHPLSVDQFRDIVLITDGEISDEVFVMELAKRHAGRTALHTVGIGNGPNEFLINGLARVSGGASALIAPNERIEPKILRLFKKVIDGPVRNLRIAWDRDVDQTPGEVVAFLGQATSIFARSAAGCGVNTKVRITGETRSGARTWDIPLEPVHSDVPIPVLWAREKIREIEADQTETAGSRQRERRQSKSRQGLIALSKQYGIVSSETSYVGIEKRAASDQTTDEMALRKVPVMLTEGWGGLFDPRARKGVPLFSRAMYSLSDRSSRVQYSVQRTSAVREGNDLDADGIMACDPAPYESKKRLPFHIPTFLRRAPAAPPAEEVQDILLELLSGQQANGGFIITDSLLKKAGLAELRDRAETVTTKSKGDKTRLMMTLAVLLILEMRFQARRDEWESVVRKSRDWLKAEIERTQSTIDNQPLEQWLREYLANQSDLQRLA
jgi:Ca-activated chloride channel family protein